MQDEYLLMGQAGYLLSKDKDGMDKLILYDKLPCIKANADAGRGNSQGRRLVLLSDLKAYVDKEMTRYSMARIYLSANDKNSFWKIQKKKFANCGRWCDDSMIEYLTLSQVAYLFGISRQAAHGLIKRGAIKGRFMELTGRTKPIIYVRADEIEKFIKKNDQQYALALQYFKTDDRYKFWMDHADGYQKKWVEVNKQRGKKYYAKKIQKRNCGTDPDGSTAGARTGATAR